MLRETGREGVCLSQTPAPASTENPRSRRFAAGVCPARKDFLLWVGSLSPLRATVWGVRGVRFRVVTLAFQPPPDVRREAASALPTCLR